MTQHFDDNDEHLKRRGENVGQSGRWARDDGITPGERRYGNEERWHSSEHMAGVPAKGEHPQPCSEKPSAGPYKGDFAPSGEAGEKGDDKVRFPAKSYSDAGGTQHSDKSKHPSERWKDQGGAGFGERYGEGQDEQD